MRLKPIAFGVVVALAVAVVAAVVAIKSIDTGKLSAVVAREVKTATGRDLAIGGALDLRISLAPAVVAENVSLANAAWGTRREMATVKRVEAEIALLPLFAGKIKLARLVLIEPDVLFETDAKGRGNWVFPDSKLASAADEAAGKGPALEFGEIRAEKAVIGYRDGKSRQSHRLVLDRLQLATETGSGNLKLDLEGSFDHRALRLTAKTGSLAALLAAEARFPLELTAEAGRAGMSGPMVLTLTGRVTRSGQKIAIDDFKFGLAKITLNGKVGAEFGRERPLVTAELAAPLLDLSAALAPTAKSDAVKTPAGEPQRVFSADPLPLNALNAADAVVEIKADKVALPGNRSLGALRAHAVLNRGRLDLDPLQFNAGGGRLTARATVDASARGTAAVAVTVEGRGLALGELMALVGRQGDISGGKSDVNISLKGRGSSVRSLMAALDGNVRMVVGPARLKRTEINIAGDILSSVLDAANPFRKKDDYTELRCAVARVPINNGVARVERSIALDTSKVSVVAAGTVNLANETLNVAVRPKAKEGLGIGAGELASVVRVTGTLAEPALGIDAAGAATQMAKIGAAMATGGMSLLGGALLGRATSEDVCAAALAEPAGKTRGPSGQPAQEEQDTGFFSRIFGK